ncbi:glycine--tRNA ligase subunit beta, partial [candidate division WOR-3 bacterium]|nr:glycine--tRNA ligase subunit beta [candidate division WOR-3 bacterium]
ETAARLFPGADAGLEARLDDFFRERMAALLADRGIIYDIANAVLAVAWHTPAETLARAQALTAFRARPEFEKLVIGQKRVANILKGVTTEGLPEADLFAEDAEKELWSKTCEVEGMVDSALAHGKYQEACGMLLQLREHIDRLFDEVMVMAEDAKLRDNRLRLLACVRSLFRKVADLSLIVLEGETGA